MRSVSAHKNRVRCSTFFSWLTMHNTIVFLWRSMPTNFMACSFVETRFQKTLRLPRYQEQRKLGLDLPFHSFTPVNDPHPSAVLSIAKQHSVQYRNRTL